MYSLKKIEDELNEKIKNNKIKINFSFVTNTGKKINYTDNKEEVEILILPKSVARNLNHESSIIDISEQETIQREPSNPEE